MIPRIVIVLLLVRFSFGGLFKLIETGNNSLLYDVLNNIESAKLQLDTLGVDGRTPLMYASLIGNIDAAKILLNAGANPNTRGLDGYAPIDGASFQGHAEIVKLLISVFGINPSALHEDGFKAIHRACWGKEQRHTETVHVLLLAGVPVNDASSSGGFCIDMTDNEGTMDLLRRWAVESVQ